MQIRESETSMKPLVSIIIPTKSRNKYVTNCVEGILSTLGDENYEIVVFDTNSSDELKSLLPIHEGRLRYFHNPDISGFSRTFDFASKLGRGDYTCMIGDDDGVTKNLLDWIRWAIDNNIDSFCSQYIGIYRWPDYYDKMRGYSDSGKLFLRRYSDRVIRIDVAKEFSKLSKSGFIDFSHLPRLYYGVIRTEVLRQAKSSWQSLFMSSSPDISSSVILGSEISNHYVIGPPIFIAGASRQSGSGRTASGEHIGKLEDEEWMKPYVDNWPSQVPRVFSPYTMWAHSAFETLTIKDKYNILKSFNREALIAQVIVFSPSLTNDVMKSTNIKDISILKLGFMIVKCIFSRIGNLAGRIFGKGKYDYFYSVNNVENVAEAMSSANIGLSNFSRPSNDS